MRALVVDELEEFVGHGSLWDAAELAAMVERLRAESGATADPIPRLLSRPLASLLLRLQMGVVGPRMAADIEAIVYPRLWKVMEAVRDDLPDGELRTRIEVLNRRLSRRFAEESDHDHLAPLTPPPPTTLAAARLQEVDAR